jgi:putative two-component system response regulator
MLPSMSEAPPFRVLLVDDDPVIVRLLEVNFRLEGFHVRTASSGEQALEKAAEEPPDAMVIDVMMPGLDGWEVCARLREHPETADIPVVFLSARARDEDRSRGYALGVVEYVMKPFDPADLIEVVRGHLAGHEGPE